MNRAIQILQGAFLSFLTLFLFLSVISYHPQDPSPIHASGQEVRNIMGLKGAWIADLLVQTINYSLTLPLAFLAMCSVNLVRGGKQPHTVLLRFLIMLMTVPLLSLSLATLSPSTSFPSPSTPMPYSGEYGGGYANEYGGYVGFALYSYLFSNGADGEVWYLFYCLTLIGVLLSFPISQQGWLRMFGAIRCILGLFLYLIKICATLLGRVFNTIRRFLEERYRHQRAIMRQKKRDTVHLSCDELLDMESDEQILSEQKGSDPSTTEDMPDLSREKMKGGIVQINKEECSTKNKRLREIDADSLPPTSLLRKGPGVGMCSITAEKVRANADMLTQVLSDYGVEGNVVNISPGPVVTLYEYIPSAGTKSSKIIGLSDDIARSMKAVSTRISVVPGRDVIGIELPNETREIVYLRELLESSSYSSSNHLLPIVLGKDIAGNPVVADLAKMPHLLVAGTTGSGKSVSINTMILSLLYMHSPENCRFIMIDPKMLELSVYEGIPHLLAPVVTDPKKAVVALRWVVREMEKRYKAMSSVGVRNIGGFNAMIEESNQTGSTLKKKVQKGFDHDTGEVIFEEVTLDNEKLPYIVVMVDEMADLMLVAGKEIEVSIQRLAQMARAAGIHIIMATQRPSVDVITGVIKANFPIRISFQVTSKVDSRTILGEQGAEQLLGMGDMLYMSNGVRIKRVHGPFVDDKEVENIVNYLKQRKAPDYDESILNPSEDDMSDEELGDILDGAEDEGELYSQALSIVLKSKKASTSYIQRSLRIGYNRAANIIERMEKEGVVSPPNHVGKREVLQKGFSDE